MSTAVSAWARAAVVSLLLAAAAAVLRGAAARGAPHQSLPLPVSAPPTLTLGPAAGAPRVVIFSDYECVGCAALERELGPRLRAWAAAGRLRLEIRHFPLAPHRRARRAAAWAICAAWAGRGWEMHDALLASSAWRGPGPSAPALAALAHSLGLQQRTMERCAQERAATERLTDDLALGRAAEVAAVPAVFLNGRALDVPSPRTLLGAVERAMQ